MTTIAKTMQPFATLYRRPDKNFFSEPEERKYPAGPNQIYGMRLVFETPGWIAFDFAANVAHTDDGQVALGKFQLFIDGVLRWEARGSYTWTRVYVYVDAGSQLFRWETDENYKAEKEDRAFLRYINATAFEKVEEIAAIELAKPPKHVQQLTRFATLDGFDRYQQIGTKSAHIKARLIFAPGDGETANEKYARFSDKYINFYIIRYSSGLYGGALIEVDPETKGPLILADVTLDTAQRAGVSVTGL